MESTMIELVFVPSVGAGHVFPMVELANHLVRRYPTLSVTICIMKMPFKSISFEFTTKKDDTGRIKFIDLDPPTMDPNIPPSKRFSSFLEGHGPQIKDIVAGLVAASHELAGFVLDMFCTSFIDVANEFGVPSYVFYTCGATFLGFMFHLQNLYDQGEIDPIALRNSDTELAFPSLMSPLPGKNLPSDAVEAEWLEVLVNTTRRMREARGIMVNTYHELESHAVDSLSNGETPPVLNPKVYPVGPILNLKEDTSQSSSATNDVIQWLDDKPECSVVFLCFGSMGAFGGEQVKEIASALEQSGHRFLWSLRRRSDAWVSPTDYEDFNEVLPEGFLDRTEGVGKVIGWAPQTAVLGHKAIGGFVSHCGWNSTLESLWFGVPMATWPMYAEQQMNGFLVVKELGIGTEIKMDYRVESGEIVKAEEIERGIRNLMDKNCGLKNKMDEFSEKMKQALGDSGSSSSSIAQFIGDL
ncbi:UDP-glycosyltransferase 71A15 [Linum perenne]